MSSPASGDFERFVDGLAAQLVALSPTFDVLVAAMPGVSPEEALAALHRITGPEVNRLLTDAACDRAGAIIDQCAELPLPHPLDSEFRFDPATAAALATALVDATRPGEEILLVGVPSVAIELARSCADRTIRFLGPDNCVTTAVRAAFNDERLLLDQGPGGTAGAALLDPPWYPEPMAELIGVCAAGMREGASVRLVIPPIGTRPDITADRSMFLDFAITAGMKTIGIEGPVRYRTPLFELAAMERQGIARLPCWRRAEVVEFVAVGPREPHRWRAPRPTELSVAGVRLQLVRGDPGGDTLVPVDAKEVFPSVSSRAPGRTRATLWTTTNRAFAVDYDIARSVLAYLADNPALLHLGLAQPQNHHGRDRCLDASVQLTHQLVELVGREFNDACRLVGDGAWLKAKMEWRC